MTQTDPVIGILRSLMETLDHWALFCRKPVAMREAILQTQLLELQRSETSVLRR